MSKSRPGDECLSERQKCAPKDCWGNSRLNCSSGYSMELGMNGVSSAVVLGPVWDVGPIWAEQLC